MRDEKIARNFFIEKCESELDELEHIDIVCHQTISVTEPVLK